MTREPAPYPGNNRLLVGIILGVLAFSLFAQTTLNIGGGLSSQEAVLLTVGYAIAIVGFIRVGEKLLQKFGAANR